MKVTHTHTHTHTQRNTTRQTRSKHSVNSSIYIVYRILIRSNFSHIAEKGRFDRRVMQADRKSKYIKLRIKNFSTNLHGNLSFPLHLTR